MTKSNQGTPEHTPEQWNFYPKLSGSENHKGFVIYKEGRNTFRIADVMPIDSDGKEGEANARRIVACVNACEGIPTEQLEKDFAMSYEAHKSEVKSETKAAQARVAELEKALQGIFDTCPTDPDVTKEFYDAWVRARAALDGGAK